VAVDGAPRWTVIATAPASIANPTAAMAHCPILPRSRIEVR
jgi:hypothetical protein